MLQGQRVVRVCGTFLNGEKLDEKHIVFSDHSKAYAWAKGVNEKAGTGEVDLSAEVYPLYSEQQGEDIIGGLLRRGSLRRTAKT